MLLILAASPHANGVTDLMAHKAEIAAKEIGKIQIIFLRQYTIKNCTGCNYCKNTGECVFQDDAPGLFAMLQTAKTLLIVSPIYFYALPAPFKTFIDRSQPYWQYGHKFDKCSKNAGIILTAGRSEGNQLFSGALLTLRWFLKPFSFDINQTLLCRGADSPESEQFSHCIQQASHLGKILAQC